MVADQNNMLYPLSLVIVRLCIDPGPLSVPRGRHFPENHKILIGEMTAAVANYFESKIQICSTIKGNTMAF